LGGGPAGLSAAWLLAKSGAKVDLIERMPFVGGMSTTITLDGCRVDYAPLVFQFKEGEALSLVKRLLRDDLTKVRSKTKMRIRNRDFDYPLRIGNLMRGLPVGLSLRIVVDYLYALLKSKIVDSADISFHDWCTKRFGRSLADLCFLSYTEKVWGMLS